MFMEAHTGKVMLNDKARGGLLGQGSILLVTSDANRTSPVVRGKWVLENLLRIAAPPPPDVPSLKENTEGTKPLSVRERLEEHGQTRRAPVATS